MRGEQKKDKSECFHEAGTKTQKSKESLKREKKEVDSV